MTKETDGNVSPQKSIRTFQELGLNHSLQQAVEELGFKHPMPVQAEVIPILLNEQTDLVALAQTGTGKTAAFGLPALQSIDTTNKDTEILVLSPTRELCMQIAKDLKNFASYLDVNVVAVYGGASITTQITQLKGGAKVIVATPGRMLDLIRRKSANVSKIKCVVLDEADEMLNMGFKEELDAILEQTPSEKQTWLFSATMPKEVEGIARNYMTEPRWITVGTRNAGAENVHHYYYLVHARDRYPALKRIADYYPNIYAIVFCRTRAETQEVADALIKDGYNADALHGDLSQAQRDHVMNRFRRKNLQMLVATDVAARGLDVNNLTHVINYNLPDEVEQYTHRSGRTGRADKTGISIAIINLREKHKIRQIEKIIKKDITQVPIPTGQQVCEKQLFHLIDTLENVSVNEDEISDYLPFVYKKLEKFEKEDIINRFVSLEFNRFLDYYRNAPDLNVKEEREARKKGGEQKKERRKEGGEQKERREKREKPSGGQGEFVKLFINLGKRDAFAADRLIRLVNKMTRNRDIAIGRIDLFEAYSHFEVRARYVQEVIENMDDYEYRGVTLVVEPVGAGSRKNKKRDKNKR